MLFNRISLLVCDFRISGIHIKFANAMLGSVQKRMYLCDHFLLLQASVSLLFAHKDFIGNILYDWSYKSPSDLLFFVPYTFKINFQLDEFELYLPLNKYNWVDCRTNPKENGKIRSELKNDRMFLICDVMHACQ